MKAKVIFAVVFVVAVVVAAIMVQRGDAPQPVVQGVESVKSLEDEIVSLKELARQANATLDIESIRMSSTAGEDDASAVVEKECTASATIRFDDKESTVSVTAEDCEEALAKIERMFDRPGNGGGE